MAKKIPYGISNFKSLIEQEYIYIDKTRYIEELENISEKYIFFLRPRRFGKSLFLSMLSTYYDVREKDNFNNIFNGLYIQKNPTKLRGTYYILQFSFSGIITDSKEALINGFRRKVIDGLRVFINKYNIKHEINENLMPSEIINSFFVDVRYSIKGDIYLLIDEYDHFANELLSFQTEVFEEVISKTGFVRKFYEVIKDATMSGVVDRIFATGVSPITLDSLTSGFNISSNITRKKRFNEMLGFTDEEVRYIITNTIDLKKDIKKDLKEDIKEDIIVDDILEEMKRYYNGYLFSEDAETRLYNSDLVLYFVINYQEKRGRAFDLIDPNVSMDYSKLANLFELKNKDRNFKILKEIIEEKPQNCIITQEYSLAKEFTDEDFKSLLFYLGFLTIKSTDLLGNTVLRVPNYVVKEIYFDYFRKLIEKEENLTIENSELRLKVTEFAINGNIKPIIESCEDILKRLSNRDFIKFDEKYIKILLITLFMTSKIYYVKSEYETSGGYIDIALLKRAGINPNYQAIIEVKYIKKEDDKEEVIHNKLDEARKQLDRYKEDEELKSMDNLLKIALVFVGDECRKVDIN